MTDEATLLQTWAGLFDGNPSSTIRPADSLQPVDGLAALLDDDGPPDVLNFQSTIGTGGMGVVRVARQERLRRDVAVKSLRREVRTDQTTSKLLSEAWVTGGLQHPNIVPVYNIAVDADRQPHILMKRITGVEWASVMDDEGAIAERFRTQDALGWNLSILVAVCNAVDFAHANGVVHRDLKPENVMIGEFGEVYLVDWGIAQSLDGREGVPTVGSGRVAGTPRYLAPEMARAEAACPKTDVFLLGALLLRIFTGAPPHKGWSIQEILTAALQFELRLPDHIPVEFALLLVDAMAPDRDQRIDSAAEFRDRLVDAVEHRGSARVAATAIDRLRALQDELAGEPERLAVYSHLGACRFGFQEALHTWPENRAALDGLETALEAVFWYEIDAGDHRSAALLLGEIRQPSSEAQTALARLESDAQAEALVLERLRNDNDPRIGARTRIFVAGVLSLLWVVLPFGVYAYGDVPGAESQVRFGMFMTVLVGSFVFWGRHSLGATPLNRAIASMFVAAPVCKVAIHGLALFTEQPMHLGVAHELFAYTLLCFGVAVTLDRRAGFAVLSYLVFAVLVASETLDPLIGVGLSSGALFATVIVMWLPGLPDSPTHRPKGR